MVDTKRSKDNEIDYDAEGSTPGGAAEPGPTDQGYDEAVRSGESRYGVPEGEGGVFGTTGGGTFGGGMQIVERPVVYDHGEKPKKPQNESDKDASGKE
jgi:hypothetical protein